MEISLVFEVRKDWELHFSCGIQNLYLDVTGKSREDDTILNLQLHKHFLGGNEKSKPKQLTISTDLITLRALEIKVPDVFYCFKNGT